MAVGMYLTVGLNSVDPSGYNGWSGPLRACENDARDVAAIATTAGFTGESLMTRQATSTAVLAGLHKAANVLNPGDIFLLFYSGHGSQIGDVTGEEADQLDETWCLYDRMLIDDELFAMWSKFQPGVRILVMSDSCHSGTVTKVNDYRFMAERVALAGANGGDDTPRIKVLPLGQAWELYQQNKSTYNGLQYIAGPSEKANVGACVILISGCQDNQLSQDGSVNGVFTGALKRTWNSGNFTGNYSAFHSAIMTSMPPSQTPNYNVVGSTNLAFEAQRPFTI
jgi:metacaspase-1